ncbi:MAG: hypothetical protein KKG06_05285, partial [Bacteroidetes bacterium]|nr:hypothetical protein [Bacteroidota bacterium]MBU1422582.1 hypothetical protein [Bacteroidota bacterium]
MKKYFLIIVAVLTAAFISCQKAENKPSQILSKEEVKAEINEKMERMKKFLNENQLYGMLFTQVRNVYWITAGLANNQIVLNKDVGAASLLILKDGKKYLICNGAEAGRMMDETLRDLGYELKMFNWYEANPIKDVRGDLIKSIIKGERIGSDINFPGTVLVADKFKPYRFSLTDGEIKRYRWLGEQTTEAVEEVCKRITPDMNEFEIEAITSAELRSRG